MPLYKLLKKSEHFEWMHEAQEAITRLKDFLTIPWVLTSPSAGETLLLYTAATPHTIRVALVVECEKEGHILKVQWMVYFVSKVLADSKAHYPRIQKLLYAVLIAKRKLRHYFDGHPMVVISSSGLGDVINNRESTAASPSVSSSSWASTSPTLPEL
ncbi:uncharacterized protein [Miscanthus floridulus]|uniref:uncharacterized protein n=1 Tax=Miscanthus floridulus TaxID=154761 RepID=UPI0034586E06